MSLSTWACLAILAASLNIYQDTTQRNLKMYTHHLRHHAKDLLSKSVADLGSVRRKAVMHLIASVILMPESGLPEPVSAVALLGRALAGLLPWVSAA